eukprot:s147_g32.t1
MEAVQSVITRYDGKGLLNWKLVHSLRVVSSFYFQKLSQAADPWQRCLGKERCRSGELEVTWHRQRHDLVCVDLMSLRDFDHYHRLHHLQKSGPQTEPHAGHRNSSNRHTGRGATHQQ